MASKTNSGNFFEDFSVGMKIDHATPRTITVGDVAVYAALYGSRFAVQSSDEFARAIGYARSPVDDLLVFHVVFGKTVPDVSLNAVANLGYAECVFRAPVYPGDTLRAESDVIGVKENSNKRTGVVYVRSRGLNQRDEVVLDYARWVMVHKRDQDAPAPVEHVPDLAGAVEAEALDAGGLPGALENYDFGLSGSAHRFEDYAIGEKIDHSDAMTIEEAEHQTATRLYQNTAKVHFNALEQKDSRFGRRLIYGGVVISLSRALSFNGLENGFKVLAINGGRHVAPSFAGDTIYAWSEVIDVQAIPGVKNAGAMRLRTTAIKDRNASTFVRMDDKGQYAEGVVLDMDYWVAVPR
ncbi:MAG: MaoC family dehydratase [Alphaproteobacteria bacterium]|nr:MaoC family dehydratase [Alphaproteobacteria bacterium]